MDTHEHQGRESNLSKDSSARKSWPVLDFARKALIKSEGDAEAKRKKSTVRNGGSRKLGNQMEISNLARKENVGEVLVPRRKSVSAVETNVVSVAAFVRAKVRVADMPDFMQVHAFRCARRTYDSLETFSPKHMACNMKKEFDKAYGPAWHCIVGRSFGSFVTHATGCFLYFSIEKVFVLVFKTRVEKAKD